MLKVAAASTFFGLTFWLLAFGWFLFTGYVFLLCVGAWAIVTVKRMEQKQEIAMGTLNQLAALTGLQRSTDKLEKAVTAAVDRSKKPDGER